ncbi:MAG: YraN family protein [Ezakiella sp.]|nr:YraN family protein [Ezakiella sp.]MDD7471564.1 YraN family protein [Bacillota bacterium]MDY3922800.1 YraN family protein [Ezakiella sp.]
MKQNNKIFGDLGEDMAVDLLKKKGYMILERNYRNKYGEVDIIALKDEFLVFVEVKARKNRMFGSPQEAVDDAKIKHIVDTADGFLQERAWHNVTVRFDIVEIVFDEKFIQHIENAFYSYN